MGYRTNLTRLRFLLAFSESSSSFFRFAEETGKDGAECGFFIDVALDVGADPMEA